MPEKLSSGDLLNAEYDYIAQAIFQANEDRSRVASFYMITFGSFIAALITYRFDSSTEQQVWVLWAFAGLFLALATMGVSTILQLARLRHAWFEGVDAMNQLKDYYIANFPGLEQAFAWRRASVPQKFKVTSVGFVLVVQVSILGGASLGTAVFFAALAASGSAWLFPAFLVGLVFCLAQLDLYRNMLKK